MKPSGEGPEPLKPSGGGDDTLIVALSVLIALVLILILGAVAWIYVQRRQRKGLEGGGVDAAALCGRRARQSGLAALGAQVSSLLKGRGAAAKAAPPPAGEIDVGVTVDLGRTEVLEAIVSLEEQEQASMYEIALERIAHINQALAERSTTQAAAVADVSMGGPGGKSRLRESAPPPASFAMGAADAADASYLSRLYGEQADDAPGAAEPGSSKAHRARYDLPPPPPFSTRPPLSDSASGQATPFELSDSHSHHNGDTPQSSTSRPSVVSLSALGSVSRAELARMMRSQHAAKPAPQLALSAGPSSSTVDKLERRGSPLRSPRPAGPHSPRPHAAISLAPGHAPIAAPSAAGTAPRIIWTLMDSHIAMREGWSLWPSEKV